MADPVRLPEGKEPVLRVMPMPADANHLGDILSLYAEIVRVGNTSITVTVEVYAQRNPEDIEIVKVTEATLTYVATDKNRRPRAVLPLPAKKLPRSPRRRQ